MGVMHKIMDYFGFADKENMSRDPQDESTMEEEEWYDEDAYHAPANYKEDHSQKVVRLQAAKRHSIRMIMAQPSTYEEAQELADHLRARRIVAVNLSRLRTEQAKRVVDFLSGTVYALGGNIQKLGTNLFICTPDHVDVHGTIAEVTQEDLH